MRKLTLGEKERIKYLKEHTDLEWEQIGNDVGIGGEHARSAYRNFTGTVHGSYRFNKIADSPYPKYNQPLEQEGDCLVLPDPEFPFHNADFINRCVDLALSWKVRNCNIAGDAMHFNSISHWEANWKSDTNGELSDKAHAELFEFALELPEQYQQALIDKLEEYEPSVDGDVGSEVSVAKLALTNLGTAFDDIVYVIGNHDGRLLSALNSPMFADQLKAFTVGNNPKYRIAPYYYSTLHTEGGDYSIEHPVSASKTAAVQIASKKLCHVLMGHSHRYSRLKDPSDRFWCVQMGTCVDEERLAYVGQRTRGAEKHSTGAVIVRGGFPFDLSPETPWELYKRM